MSNPALCVNGCVRHMISTFKGIFGNTWVLGQSQKHTLKRVHKNNFTLFIYLNTSKSSAIELCPKASSPEKLFYSLLKHLFFSRSVCNSTFPLFKWTFTVAQIVFSPPIFLHIPPHCKQTLKPEVQLNLSNCSNLKARDHNLSQPCSCTGGSSLSGCCIPWEVFSFTCLLLGAPSCGDVQCSMWGQEQQTFCPSFRCSIKNTRARVSRVEKPFLYLAIWTWPRTDFSWWGIGFLMIQDFLWIKVKKIKLCYPKICQL